MGKMMVKKTRWFFAIFAILALISGCETVDAIRTGDIKMRDIGYMIGLGITGDIDKENTVRGITGDIDKENTVWEKIKKADTWFQQNLW